VLWCPGAGAAERGLGARKSRRSIALLLVLLLAVLVSCSEDDTAVTHTTVDLTDEEEAWWCESLTEAQEWGLSPVQYAAYA